MSAHLLQDRATRLFIALAAFFCVNAVLAEFIGVKIFALEDTLGIAPLEWNLFGQTGSLTFTAGTLLWPIVFVFTDVINEFFGTRGVRMISWIAVALIPVSYTHLDVYKRQTRAGCARSSKCCSRRSHTPTAVAWSIAT